jgi:hypothetical protein
MGLADRLEGKNNIELRVVMEKPQEGILEFYLEASYENDEGKDRTFLHGPVTVDKSGHPVVPEHVDNGKDYTGIAHGLGLDTIDQTIVPKLLDSLKVQLGKLKEKGVQVLRVGNYSLEEAEQLYSEF